MELTYEYRSKYIAFCFVSNGFSLCTSIIADDTVLVQLEATVPVVTVQLQAVSSHYPEALCYCS